MVNLPSLMSEPAGLPMVSSSATRSRASSAIWNTMPSSQAQSERASTTEGSASAGVSAAPAVAPGSSTVVYPPAYPPAYPPPTYSQPYPSFWTPGAAFVGGALVGGLLGYAIGDDDDDIEVYHHGDGYGGASCTRPIRFRYSGVIDSAIVSPIASWNAAFAPPWNR